MQEETTVAKPVGDEEAPETTMQEETTVEKPVGDEEAPETTKDVAEPDVEEVPTKKRVCGWFDFRGVRQAQGYALLGTGRGAVVMSNIFLSTSLIYLASEAAGCLDEQGNVVDECDNKVHGFQPPTLITNIAVISGLLSAFLMPLIGAIVDFTSHRRSMGIVAATVLTLIQAAQIGTVSATWYPMAILQAIAGFIYQVQLLASYAYLPEIARLTEVGQRIMTKFTSTFVMMQFSSQALFLVVVIAIGYIAGLNDVNTAQISQAISVVWISITFGIGWHRLPKVPARHKLPAGHWLLMEGFTQIWRTTKSINRNYPHGLRWFLLATIFAEAGANAFTVVSVVYLDAQLGMSGLQIGLVFLITLVCSVPGAKLGSKVTKRTNPNTSLKICLASFSIVTLISAFVLNSPKRWYLSYVFGVLWGAILGWFYSTENLFFSLCLPPGQEAELTGFFVYCTQVLVWLPPLVFSLMIEAGVSQHWGLMSLIIYLVIAIALLSFVAPWDEVIEEASKDPIVDVTKLDVTEEGFADDDDSASSETP